MKRSTEIFQFMKAITFQSFVMASVLVSALSAADKTRVMSAVPTTIYNITEPIENAPLGNSRLFELTRKGKTFEAAFSNKLAAEAFLMALPNQKNHRWGITALPKSLISEVMKNGGAFLLDPQSISEGGEQIVADPSIDNSLLKSLCDADQAERRPEAGKQIDWTVTGPRDAQRLSKVMELYHEGKIITGNDYINAALILQHGTQPEDYLLAHEFAIIALRKGNNGLAPWLVAASEDRFLESIGRKQRFGTQLQPPLVVDGQVTDLLRAELNVPSLSAVEQQAKEQ